MFKLFFNNKLFFIIFLTSLIVSRLIAFYFYRDVNLENEWAILLHNLEVSGVLGFNVHLDNNVAVPRFAESGETVIPSVWMPPFYIFFMYVVSFFPESFLSLVNAVLIVQIFLNFLSIIIFYLVIKKFLNQKQSLLFTTIFAFFPVLIFASVQISSITIQIFLILCLFYFIQEIFSNMEKFSLFFFSFFSGILILTRGEFIIFYFFTLFYFFIFRKIKIKKIITSIIVTSIVLSPYLIRNYKNFETIVLTKSLGYNLLKGNNKNFKVEGDVYLIDKIRENTNIKINNNFEINLDNIYKDEAIKFIKDNPLIFIKNYLKKFFSFLIMDLNSTYQNYYHPLHLVPKLIISVCALIGAVVGLREKSFFQYLSFYYFLNFFFFSVFFILPRYSVILIPVQLLIVGLAFQAYKYKKEI